MRSFISDRDGPLDVWLSQVGTGSFENRIQGSVPNLDSLLRAAGFSGDGADLWLHGDDKLGLSNSSPLGLGSLGVQSVFGGRTVHPP